MRLLSRESNRPRWPQILICFIKKLLRLLSQPYRWKRVLNRMFVEMVDKWFLFRRSKNYDMPVFSISQGQRYAIDRFIQKVRTGDYLFCPNPCLCGSNDSILVACKDRYGIAQDTQLCCNCGLMRTDPYFTADSLLWFYHEDYYDIYLGEIEIERYFLDQQRRGRRILEWFRYSNIFGYNSVFDVGCGPGGILDVFRCKGLRVAGCDYQLKFLSYGWGRDLNVTYGDAQVLKNFGKADLLILSHIVEHFRDPVSELSKMQALLNENGLIYIEIPGIFSIKRIYGDLSLFLQNAHAWYFCLSTLDYLMAKAGFKRIAGDEFVRAVYKPTPAPFQIKEDPEFWKKIKNYLGK